MCTKRDIQGSGVFLCTLKEPDLVFFTIGSLPCSVGLLSYYPHCITNGPLEGFNYTIRTMKLQANGFRDQEYFTLRLHDLHNSRYAIAG